MASPWGWRATIQPCEESVKSFTVRRKGKGDQILSLPMGHQTLSEKDQIVNILGLEGAHEVRQSKVSH